MYFDMNGKKKREKKTFWGIPFPVVIVVKVVGEKKIKFKVQLKVELNKKLCELLENFN
jgi:hypothetical protein